MIRSNWLRVASGSVRAVGIFREYVFFHRRANVLNTLSTDPRGLRWKGMVAGWP